MSSHSIRIHLENNPGCQKPFTSLDIIKGVVCVEIHNTQLEVEKIKIELEGLSLTSITKEINSISSNEAEIHPLLYDSEVLFPLTREADTTGSFLLNPGYHQFEFSFQIPLNCYCGNPIEDESFSKYNSPSPLKDYICKNKHIFCSLPPTISKGTNRCEDIFEIAYFLKATIVQHASHDMDPVMIIPLQFTSFESDCPLISHDAKHLNKSLVSSLEKELKTELKSTSQKLQQKFLKKLKNSLAPSKCPKITKRTFSSEIKLKVQKDVFQFGGISLPRLSLVTEASPLNLTTPITDQLSQLGSIFISNLEIYLINSVDYKAKELRDTFSKRIDLLNVQDCLKLDFTQSILNENNLYELILPFLSFEDVNIPSTDEFVPTFRTCNISNSYRLNINLHLKVGSMSAEPLRFEYDTEISVSSGIRSSFISSKEAELFEMFNSSVVVSDISSSYSEITLLDNL